ncbi:MAG: adenylosuccinate synthase [Alphaproteobacteria bacterium]|nr:adenylosuccinate synthase [Alphaproteobacteria bacterium]
MTSVKTADAVIGAGYGDEGKGLTTDFLATRAGGEGHALVVRFNGGAQAGHTVVAPDGRRHIYSHVTSGAMSAVPGFLSRFFVCNPLLFVKEYAQLQNHGTAPVLHVDERAPVTTPYDMMINQIVEESRGHGRHGSCGMGFGETVERQQHAEFALCYADLNDKSLLREKLEGIRHGWLPERLKALGVEQVSHQWRERIDAEGIMEKFMADAAFFLKVTKPEDPGFLARWHGRIVFEGAQGLLLDQARGHFPHVTRSHTGLKNVLTLCAEASIGAVEAFYVTRTYATRHGAGPLAHELQKPPYAAIVDETNVHNPHQGNLRFGWLDADILARAVADDLSDAEGSGIEISHGLSVTCVDQLDPVSHLFEVGVLRAIERNDFAAHLLSRTKGAFLIESHGPTRSSMRLSQEVAA